MSSERPEHDTARPRRRSPAVVTSVAAAVLLAGGGGAYWAATAAGHDNGGTETSGAPGGTTGPPPLALDQSARSSGSPGIAPGEPDPRGPVYRSDGTFPAPPKTAPVYRADGAVSAADVAKLAGCARRAGHTAARGYGLEGGPGQGRLRPAARGRPTGPRHLDIHPLR